MPLPELQIEQAEPVESPEQAAIAEAPRMASGDDTAAAGKRSERLPTSFLAIVAQFLT